jgi:serine/threonine-protein kinase RsbW
MSAGMDAGTVERTVTLSFAARPEYLVLARLALTGIGVAERLGSEDVADLKLAVTEACTNAIEHAYGGDGGNQEITISFTIAPEALTVEVSDRGAGFDPSEIREIESEPTGTERGMGLAIIVSLTDELSVVSSNGDGSSVRFSKRLAR